MLLHDKRAIGNKLLMVRKRAGMTQIETAVASDLSERAYADIERGETNMRVGTLLKICSVFHVTPNDILTEDEHECTITPDALANHLSTCSEKERATALQLLNVYLRSL